MIQKETGQARWSKANLDCRYGHKSRLLSETGEEFIWIETSPAKLEQVHYSVYYLYFGRLLANKLCDGAIGADKF